MSKRTSYDKIYRPDVRGRRPDVHARPRSSHGCDFTRGQILLSALVKNRPRGCNPASSRTWCVRADAFIPSPPFLPPLQTHMRTLQKINKINKNNLFFKFKFKFLVVVAVLKREKKISVFGFQSPRFPSSASEATRRRRFFRPSSPSHPCKLYSSLGWLNSKVPKPFPPFSLRLIDVDGF
jgi:hypothetical protein